MDEAGGWKASVQRHSWGTSEGLRGKGGGTGRPDLYLCERKDTVLDRDREQGTVGNVSGSSGRWTSAHVSPMGGVDQDPEVPLGTWCRVGFCWTMFKRQSMSPRCM